MTAISSVESRLQGVDLASSEGMSHRAHERLERLLSAVSASLDASHAGASGPDLLIVPHNDPDPDAIASAYALQVLLAKRLKVESRIGYRGMVGRAENKALVRYLGNPLHPMEDLESPAMPAEGVLRPRSLALVDAQPGAGNVTLPAGSPVTIVIDHHPERPETADAVYADIRPTVGATSTILTEYVLAAGFEPSSLLCTALFYGIKTDTLGLSRGAGAGDVAAYFYLQPRIDVQALAEIENAQVPAAYFRSFDATLRAARVYAPPVGTNKTVIAYVGRMDYPDLAAEMADLLLRLQRSRWVVCMGSYKGKLLLSVRTRSQRRGADELVMEVVGDSGTAGGHGPTAAGQIPLEGQNPELVAERIRRRVLGALGIEPDTEGHRLV